jgi:hypothetical protein
MSTRTEHTTQQTAEDRRRDVSTRSVSWTASTDHPLQRCTKTALFRETADAWVLQHVRTVTLRQRGETTSSLDPDASLSDVPTWAIDEAGLKFEGGVLRG